MSVLYYILYLTVALGIIIKAYLLVKRYPSLPLSSYLYFLIIYTILGFLKLILTYIAPQIFKMTSMKVLVNLHVLLLFLIFPLIPMGVYFFIQFVISFLNLELPQKVKRGYIIFWVVMCAGFAAAVNVSIEIKDVSYANFVFMLSVLASLLFLTLSALRT
ncbi:hypothetical protein ACFL27_23165 [candidate division CSSED10-310 bacterium]|uniref:Histidine kinase N-terminal 7TM region domain-containing protein n=1 Tax=candidate division CSSED10-310 bacterium TaxID=2855610 RepID=A0ABV6Z439_UNCC1